MNELERWRDMSMRLKKLKEEEMALRKEICGKILAGMSLPATKKHEFNGMRITAKGALSYNVDEAVLKSVWNELGGIEKQAIKWKPSIVMKTFKDLPESSMLMEAIITKPAAPTLKVEDIDV